MKIFLAAIRDLNKNEIENNEEYDKNKKVLINQLDSLKAVSYYSQKNWRNILAKEKIGQIVRDISLLNLPRTDIKYFLKIGLIMKKKLLKDKNFQMTF